MWATGVMIESHVHGRGRNRERQWNVWLEFQDDGFADQRSIRGTLCCHYLVDDLDDSVDQLVADAEKFGIEWRLGPSVYAKDEDEGLDRREAVRQAHRLGW